MQAFSRIANALGQQRFHVHVDVLGVHVPGDLAGLHIRQDVPQSCHNLVRVSLRNDSLLSQHGCMGNRTGDVLLR